MTDSAAATSPERPPCPLWAKIIATGGGVGYIPFAPGTWGSLAAIGIFFLIFRFFGVYALRTQFQGCDFILNPFFIIVPFVFLIIGLPASAKFAYAIGIKDPSKVVIDEFAGQSFALCGLIEADRWDLYSVIAAFLLFRILDIWKPWPIRWFEKLPGGWGIMMDDVVAGIFGAIILATLVHFHWLPGMR